MAEGAQEIGAERVGIRFSPYGSFLDAVDSDPNALFKHAVKEASARGIAYVHMVEPRVKGNVDTEADETKESLDFFQPLCSVPFVRAGGYQRERAAAAVKDGKAELVRATARPPCAALRTKFLPMRSAPTKCLPMRSSPYQILAASAALTWPWCCRRMRLAPCRCGLLPSSARLLGAFASCNRQRALACPYQVAPHRRSLSGAMRLQIRTC